MNQLFYGEFSLLPSKLLKTTLPVSTIIRYEISARKTFLKLYFYLPGFTYGAKTSRSSSSSGSDWASNTSSNPDLNNSEGSEGKKSVTGKLTPGLTTHQEMPSDQGGAGTRPSSRQRRQKDRGERGDSRGKTLSHISGSSDQLLPTFYENVSSIQNRQKTLGKRRGINYRFAFEKKQRKEASIHFHFDISQPYRIILDIGSHSKSPYLIYYQHHLQHFDCIRVKMILNDFLIFSFCH